MLWNLAQAEQTSVGYRDFPLGKRCIGVPISVRAKSLTFTSNTLYALERDHVAEFSPAMTANARTSGPSVPSAQRAAKKVGHFVLGWEHKATRSFELGFGDFMNRFYVHRAMVVASILLCWSELAPSSVFSQEFFSEEKAAGELRRLQKLWQSQSKEIRTARVEGDHFALMLNRPLDEQAIDRFIKAIESSLQVDADIADLKAATATLPLPAKGRTWGEFLFFMDGQRRRCRETWPAGDGNERVFDVSFDGEQEVQRWGAKQVNVVQGRGNMHATHLHDLRTIPFELTEADGKATLQNTAINDIIRVSTPMRGFSVYSASGLLRDEKLGTKRRLQYQPAQFPGGIVFPRVSATFRLTPVFSLIDIYRIRKAEFNIPMPAEQFKVPIPAGSTILDFRKAGDRPRPFRSRLDASDAIAVADERAARKSAPHDSEAVLQADHWRVQRQVP